MYSIKYIYSTIKYGEYLEGYLEKENINSLCMQCPKYDKYWACPPVATSKQLDEDGHMNIVAAKITLSKETREKPKSLKENRELTEKIIGEVRDILDAKILEMEKKSEDGLGFYAGVCRLCGDRACTKTMGKECIHKDKMRTSLEALGFNIDKACKELLGIELLWSTDNTLPEYLTLIAGLYSKA